jgi:hypothetical protein
MCRQPGIMIMPASPPVNQDTGGRQEQDGRKIDAKMAGLVDKSIILNKLKRLIF